MDDSGSRLNTLAVPRQRSLQPTSPYSCTSTIEGQDALPIAWAGHLLGVLSQVPTLAGTLINSTQAPLTIAAFAEPSASASSD